jgi:hypothetical protein
MIEEHYHNLLLLPLQRNLRNVLLLQTKFMVATNKVSCCCKQILLHLQRKPLVVEGVSRKLKNFTTGLMNGSNHSGPSLDKFLNVVIRKNAEALLHKAQKPHTVFL